MPIVQMGPALRVSFNLPIELAKRVTVRAMDKRMPRGDLMVEIIKDYFAREDADNDKKAKRDKKAS